MSSSSLPYAQHPHSLFAPVVRQSPTCLVAGRGRRHTFPTAHSDPSCYYAHQSCPLSPDLAFNAQYYTQEFTPTEFLHQSPISESTLIQEPCNDQTLSSHPTLARLQHSYYVASAGTIQESSQNQLFHWDFSSCDSYSSSSPPSVAPPSDTLFYAQSPHSYHSPHEAVQDTPRYTQPLAQAPLPSGEKPYPYPRTPSTYHMYRDPEHASGSKQQRQQQEPSDNQKNNEHNDVDNHHPSGSALDSKNDPHGASCSSPTPPCVTTSSSAANFAHSSRISTPTATPGQETMIASPHSPHHQHNLGSQIMTQSAVTQPQSNYSELSVNVTFMNQMSHFHPSNQTTFGGVHAHPQFETPLPHHLSTFTQDLSLPPTSSPRHFANGFSSQSPPTHMTTLMDNVSLNSSPISPTVAPAPRYPPPQAIVPNQFTHNPGISPQDNTSLIGHGGGGSLLNGSGLALGLDSRAVADVRRASTAASVMTTSPLLPPISSSGRRHLHLTSPVPLSHGLSLSAGVPRLSQRGNLGAVRNVRRGSASSGHPMSLAIGLPSTGGEGKKQTLACLFCRERKIACGRPGEGSLDPTCNQCARRSLQCEYPTESRRGQHKRSKKKPTVV